MTPPSPEMVDKAKVVIDRINDTLEKYRTGVRDLDYDKIHPTALKEIALALTAAHAQGRESMRQEVIAECFVPARRDLADSPGILRVLDAWETLVMAIPAEEARRGSAE